MDSKATYDQRTGVFRILGAVDDGGQERVVYETEGYAGRGNGKNNPAAEGLRGVGPLPRGSYRVFRATDHHRLGPVVFRLIQVSGNNRGRTGFFIHGDSRKKPGQASSGCIVLGPDAREAIRDYRVASLEVSASQPQRGG